MANVRDQLLQRLQAAHISEILVKQAKERILSRGADIGGYAKLWADTATLNIGTEKKPKWIDHYRKGGTPLYDTGELFNSLNSKTTITKNGVSLQMFGSDTALMQHTGFKVKGPVRVPFKDKGKHFATLINGATIPARPIFALPTSAKKEIARAIADALGAN